MRSQYIVKIKILLLPNMSDKNPITRFPDIRPMAATAIYPFPYDYYFMLDVFAIGLVYIGLYVITDSIYPSVVLMLSLTLLGIYTPPFPASLFYTLVPS